MFGDTNVIFRLWRNPKAISFSLFWVIYPIHIAVTYARNEQLDKTLLELAAQALIGPLAALVPLWIARHLILRNRRISSVRFTLLTYFLMAVFDGTTIRLFAKGSTVQVSDILAGIGVNFQFILTTFSIAAYVSITIDSLANNLQAKSSLLSKLIAKRDTTRLAAEQEVVAIQATIQSRITPILENLEFEIRNLNIEYASQDGARLAQKIQIESIAPLREASHEIAKKSLETTSLIRSSIKLQISRFRNFTEFSIYTLRGLRPPNYLTSVMLLIWSLSIVRGDCRPRNYLMNAILALILFSAASLGRIKYFKKPPRGAYLAVGAMMLANLTWFQILNSPKLECVDSRTVLEIILATIAANFTLLVSCLYPQFLAETNLVQRKLDKDIAVVRSDILRLENDVAQMRKKSASVLHGPILGRLSSIALTLKEFSDRGLNEAMEELEDMKAVLIPIITSSQAELENILSERALVIRPIHTEIDEVVQYWRGLIAVEYTVDPILETLTITHTPQLSISDLVQELITNANRHAIARHVAIEISLVGDREIPSQWRIHIKCQDDGLNHTKAKAKGLGLSPILDVGGQWNLTPIMPRGNIVDIYYPYLPDYSV